MNHKPILFSTPMVKALLAGNKTMTRRTKGLEYINEDPTNRLLDSERGFYFESQYKEVTQASCPYGEPGGLLWVREMFCSCRVSSIQCTPKDATYTVLADGSQTYKSGASMHVDNNWPPHRNPKAWEHIKMRPSIHMPKWASRLTLKITDIRVERLQDISEEDAKAEGCINDVVLQYDGNGQAIDYKGSYAYERFWTLWESINGKDSWDTNPWVWVVEFEVIRQNVLEYINATQD